MGLTIESTSASSPVPAVPPYIDAADAEEYSLRIADIVAWSAASDDTKTRALVQASDEIDALRFEGMPYGDYLACKRGAQARAFPRITLDDPSQWPDGKLLASGEIIDTDDDGEVIVPERVKFACFLQAMEILRYPDRMARLRDRYQGVTGQSAGGASESYDAGSPIKLICMEALMQLANYLLKSGRII